jgi:ABC-type bacteriocin/lantibiotic exporter with double-glycine peptidase domain
MAGRVSTPVLRLAQMWQDFHQARLSIARLGDICLACSSSVTASVPISVLSPHALVLLRWIGSA